MNNMQLVTIPTTCGPFVPPTPASPSSSTSTIPHHAKVNARYKQSASNLRTLKERFNEAMSSMPLPAQGAKRHMLQVACDDFARRYPHVTKFTKLRLCTAHSIWLSQILIDDTMQRMLDLNWVVKIIANFTEPQIMPIQVYRVPGYDGEPGKEYFASWDGQHTAIVLYLISTIVLGGEDVKVPVSIYDISCKADIRNTFICNNTDIGKKLLDKFDIFSQQVYGVRIDGSTDPEWVAAELKQQYLENNGLFLTSEKFGDIDQPGAISRAEEIVKYNPSVIKELAMYLGVSTQGIRAANPAEVYTMAKWFSMERASRKEYSMAEIIELHQVLVNKFNADFSVGGPFWELVKTEYIAFKNRENAFLESQGMGYMVTPPRVNNDWIQGGTYLWHVVKKYYTGPIPNCNINTPFVPKNV